MARRSWSTAPSSRVVACLPQFPLPGGDHAAREPWRSALGVLFSIEPALAREHGARFLERKSLELVLSALERQLNCPLTSSVGRLFDAVAALSGHPERVRFEGQAAMRLELAACPLEQVPPYPLELVPLSPAEGRTAPTLAPLVEAILRDVASGAAIAHVSARFHAALVEAALAVVERAGLVNVVLSGGCFQNALLTESLSERLVAKGHRVLLGQQIPCNDGGISCRASLRGVFHRRCEQSTTELSRCSDSAHEDSDEALGQRDVGDGGRGLRESAGGACRGSGCSAAG